MLGGSGSARQKDDFGQTHENGLITDYDLNKWNGLPSLPGELLSPLDLYLRLPWNYLASADNLERKRILGLGFRLCMEMGLKHWCSSRGAIVNLTENLDFS